MNRIKIYIDENVNIAISEGLKRRGIDAFSAKESRNLGLSDEEHLKYAVKNKSVILTHDDDFLTLADNWRKESIEHYGIIYVHRMKLTIGECIRKIEFLTKVLSAEDLKNHIEFL